MTQVLFRQRALVLYSAGQQAADIYSASIFGAALLYSATTSAFVYQLNFSEVVALLSRSLVTQRKKLNSLRTHIATQQIV